MTTARTIWLEDEQVFILDQRYLPHKVNTVNLKNLDQTCEAISQMLVRGAGLIGNTAAYGLWLAGCEISTMPLASFMSAIHQAGQKLKDTRPTASNLAWAIDNQLKALEYVKSVPEALIILRNFADSLIESETEAGRLIGEHGLKIIAEIAKTKNGKPVNILTHCNAGQLAFCAHGSALAPVYAAHAAGIPVHVYVDETRPRNQGAALTAWELMINKISHELIVDNAGGHLMQHNMVDIVITGADRVTRTGDAANKIGTYLKALAAHDNNVPFYIALPISTFDFSMKDGLKEIPIEERDSSEVRYVSGLNSAGKLEQILICPEQTPARNWGFDVTPSRLISGFICEKGICAADEKSIMSLCHD